MPRFQTSSDIVTYAWRADGGGGGVAAGRGPGAPGAVGGALLASQEARRAPLRLPRPGRAHGRRALPRQRPRPALGRGQPQPALPR